MYHIFHVGTKRMILLSLFTLILLLKTATFSLGFRNNVYITNFLSYLLCRKISI